MSLRAERSNLAFCSCERRKARLLRRSEDVAPRNDRIWDNRCSVAGGGFAVALLVVLLAASVPCLAESAPKDTAQTIAPMSPPAFSGRVVDLPKKALRAGRDTITISVDAPRGYHLTDEVPSSLCWYADSGKVVAFPKSCKSYKSGSIRFPFKLIIDTKPGQSNLTLDADVFYCEDKSKVCMIDKFRIKAPIEVSGRGLTSTTFSVELEVLEEK